MIDVERLRFRYGARDPLAVDVPRLRIEPGLTLLLGPNGAGKSSLLRLVAGVERPHHGSIRIGGSDLWRNEIAARARLAYVPEHPELTPYATVTEILAMVCSLRGVPRTHAVEAAERAGIATVAHRGVRELSQGQRRRAALAAAFVGEPDVWLLDEPFEAMDRPMRDAIAEWIRSGIARGKTIVTVSHDFGPIRDDARTAIGIRDGSAEIVSLPDEPGDRATVLEDLARSGRTSPRAT